MEAAQAPPSVATAASVQPQTTTDASAGETMPEQAGSAAATVPGQPAENTDVAADAAEVPAVQADADPAGALARLTTQTAELAARLPQGGGGAQSQCFEARELQSRLTTNGTAMLLSAARGEDYEICIKYFKLALQIDASSLQVAKLLELSLALFVDPADLGSRLEVDQLRVELSPKHDTAPRSDPNATATSPEDAQADGTLTQSARSKLYAPGLQIISPGVRKQVLRIGDSVTFPRKGDLLTMHYAGSLATSGTVFDSSIERGQPFRFQVGIGQVIQGWDEGVVRMSLGEKAVLHITSDCAYGSEEVGDGAIPANSDLVFEVELLAIGNETVGDDDDAEIIGSSVTDTVMGGLFGGAWQYITGQDLLPCGEDGVSETLPHSWIIAGCPDARYGGVYSRDDSKPDANSQAHYCNENNMHMYYKDGWWVLKDIFTPDENSSIARLLSSVDGPLQSGQHTWEWWKEGDWASLELDMRQKFCPLIVSGTPDGRFSGLYRQDATAPRANGQPHFSNDAGMHLFFGTAKGWCKSMPRMSCDHTSSVTVAHRIV